MRYLLKIFTLSVLLTSGAFAQSGFQVYDSIIVISGGNTLKNPWAGGLNFVQLSQIDMNMDGIKDLFVFDRTGNRISTYINEGIPNTVSYRYDSRYRELFPKLHDWVLLVDYNKDGKEDIFSYPDIGGGIQVYRNDSDPSGLKFTLVYSLLYSDYSGTPANLYVSSIDIPAITDVDNDGDVDVLTFGLATGNQVEFHKNLSKENTGTFDNLDFMLATNCFGKFTENAVDCSINLHNCRLSGPKPKIAGLVERNSDGLHSGSCIFCHDLNGDTATELIIGDLTCPSLAMLTNGGTPTAADYVGLDQNFPSNDSAVGLTMFPCAYYVDVDNDNVKDLFASPNANNISENFNSIWYYKNLGTTDSADFRFRQSNFLQDQMIETGEGAYPVLFDYNKDGLLDLLIGNYGYFTNPGPFKSKISLYQNTGTVTTPEFTLVTRDFAGLSSTNLTGMVPTFGDLDGDADEDMILGDYTGKLYYYEKQSGSAENFVLKQGPLKNSNNKTIDIGDFAVPRLVDVDRDGKKDLLVGARNGKVAYLRNSGTASAPVFDSITNFFGKLNVTKKASSITGYSVPFLYDSAGSFRLLVGTESGYIYRYTNIDGNLSGTFTLTDSAYMDIWDGIRSAPVLGDLDNDGKPEMILGNYAGGVAYYKGGQLVTGLATKIEEENRIKVYPNPGDNMINILLSIAEEPVKHLEVYDVLGHKIFDKDVAGNILSLETTDLPKGIYFLKLSGKTVLTAKFIIRH